MKHEFVIIGGGVAGLCAANRLCELGASPLVIEGGTYPAHKICGEFFSPASMEIVKKWGIKLLPIQHASIHTPTYQFNFQFSSQAGSLSHLEFDTSLVERAKEKGALFCTQTKVLNLQPYDSFYELTLSNGDILQAESLIIATGRLPQYSQAKSVPPTMRYVGLKAHFKGLSLPSSMLEMFALQNAYIGLSPIENGLFNVACLAKIEAYHQFNSPDDFIHSLRAQHPLLDTYLAQGTLCFSEWMQGQVPEFGVKKTPHWPHAYFIGDAAGTIAPACGNGLTMAILGGCLAAEYAIKKEWQPFKKNWHKQFASPINCGYYWHQLLLHPRLASPSLRLGASIPFLAQKVFEWTH